MNKIQYIQLLDLRGITKLEKGQSVGDAVRKSGGEATLEELVIVNEASMLYYIHRYQEEKTAKETLEKEVAQLKIDKANLEEDSLFLSCLEGAGVDNWSGYGDAQEMLDEIKNENK